MVTISEVLAKILYEIAQKDPAKQASRTLALQQLGLILPTPKQAQGD